MIGVVGVSDPIGEDVTGMMMMPKGKEESVREVGTKAMKMLRSWGGRKDHYWHRCNNSFMMEIPSLVIIILIKILVDGLRK